MTKDSLQQQPVQEYLKQLRTALSKGASDCSHDGMLWVGMLMPVARAQPTMQLSLIL